MKTEGLRRLLLAVALFALAALPALALQKDEPLKVSRLTLRTHELQYAFTGAQNSDPVDRNATDRRKGNNIYAPQLEVSNTTSKTVVKVKWRVFIYGGANREKVLRTYDYTTKREIKSGQDAVLRGGDIAHPSVEYPYPSEGKSVEITYSDGTKWSRS